jgi:hypothetical protein
VLALPLLELIAHGLPQPPVVPQHARQLGLGVDNSTHVHEVRPLMKIVRRPLGVQFDLLRRVLRGAHGDTQHRLAVAVAVRGGIKFTTIVAASPAQAQPRSPAQPKPKPPPWREKKMGKDGR